MHKQVVGTHGLGLFTYETSLWRESLDSPFIVERPLDLPLIESFRRASSTPSKCLRLLNLFPLFSNGWSPFLGKSTSCPSNVLAKCCFQFAACSLQCLCGWLLFAAMFQQTVAINLQSTQYIGVAMVLSTCSYPLQCILKWLIQFPATMYWQMVAISLRLIGSQFCLSKWVMSTSSYCNNVLTNSRYKCALYLPACLGTWEYHLLSCLATR